MNALVVQCGGPTAVINASLAALIEGWPRAQGRLWGARMGTQGLAEGRFVELPALAQAEVERLALQPGAALGSGRFALTESAIEAACAHLDAAGIELLFLIGGNGTMGAAHRMAQAAPHRRVIGIPKTIDNDLAGTDVAPGYGSAARYVAGSLRNALLDLRAMANFDQAIVFEAMGRHTGWIAAAAALARSEPNDGPHVILLPEVALDEERMLAHVAAVHREHGICCMVAAEGVHDCEGHYLAEKLGSAGEDDRGQRVFSMASGVGWYLTHRIQSELGLRCRQIRPNTLQRSSHALASPVDRDLARQAGHFAVDLARQGVSGVMVGLRRVEQAKWLPEAIALEAVVGRERPMPAEMIDAERYDVTDAFLAYAAPIAGDPEPPPLLWL